MANGATTKSKRSKANKPHHKNGKSGHAISRSVIDALLVGGDEARDVFANWRRYLGKRNTRKPLSGLMKANSVPLLWAVPEGQFSDATTKLIKRLHGIEAKQADFPAEELSDWLDSAAMRPASAEFGIECVAWAAALPYLAEHCDSSAWCDLLERLLDVAKSDYGSLEERDPWDSQLLLGELPIALGYAFPEIPECIDVLKRGCDFVSNSIVQLLDGAGLPEACHLAEHRKLLACWTRCAWMTDGNTKKTQRLSKAAREEFEWLVRQALRLTHSNGSFAFSHNEPAAGFADLISCAVRWTKDREDKALAKLVLESADISDRRLPEEPSYQSEWAELAVLQPDWAPKGPRLVVAFDNARIQAELSNHGEVIFSGDWEPVIHVDGTKLEVVSEWEVNCWFSDFDIDFLEVEADLVSGFRLQRQFALARQDLFLWTADVLLGDRGAEISYELPTKLAEGVDFASNSETFEAKLQGKRPLASVIPPALPEWRSQSDGTLDADPDGMSFALKQSGAALYAPLFFDFHPQRIRQPVTWRQLTVAENLEIVGHDQAVGFRVQAGAEQWLCYRSMTEIGNRTLLGQNYSEEFVLSRFLTDGTVDALVEISGTDDD